MNIKLIGALVTWSYPGLVGLLILIKPQFVFEPVGWLAFTNGVFVTGVGLIIATGAAVNFNRSGVFSILMMGCGSLSFAAGGLLSSIASGPGGQNVNVTIFNCGALVSSLFHLAGALSFCIEKKRCSGQNFRFSKTSFAYLLVIAVNLAIYYAAVMKWMPVFFIQGSGATFTRQCVLGTAIACYAISGLVFICNSRTKESHFFYWHARALLLISTGLTAFFAQNLVGSPLGWSGRIADYLSGLFFLIALVNIRSTEENLGVPLVQAVNTIFETPQKIFQRLSIRVWLFGLTLIVLLPFTVSIIWFTSHKKQASYEYANSKMKTIADIVASNLNMTLRDHEELLSIVAQNFSVDPPMQAQNFHPKQFVRIHTQIVHLGVRTLQGNSIYDSSPSAISEENALNFAWVK